MASKGSRHRRWGFYAYLEVETSRLGGILELDLLGALLEESVKLGIENDLSAPSSHAVMLGN